MLGSTDLPNASNRVIAIVIGICALAAVLLAVMVTIALSERIDRPAATANPAPRIASRPEPAIPDAINRSAPPRGDPVSFFSADDYPADAQRRGEQGRTVARLALDASGKPVRCDVATSSGSHSLDEATCRIALTRVHYRPARDHDGQPIASTVALPVRWVLPEEPPKSSAPASEPAPAWLPLLLGALAAFEAFTAYRGWHKGRIQAPRSSSIAVRESSPVLFAIYLGLHLLFAVALGVGAGMAALS